MTIEDYDGRKLCEMSSEEIIWCIEEALNEMSELEWCAPAYYKAETNSVNLETIASKVIQFLKGNDIDLQGSRELPVDIVKDYLVHMVHLN